MDDYFAGSATSGPAPGARTPYQPPYQPEPYAQAAPAYPPPAWPPQYPPTAPGWNPQFAPASSTSALSKAVIVVAIVLGTLVIVGILAAVAIPVILNQRAKSEAARITVAAPAKVAGWSRLTDAASLELEQQLISTPGPGTHVAGVYGTGGLKRAFFTASHAQLSFADRRGFLAGAENGAARTPEFTQVAFFDSDPGPLGGSMRCATLTANRVTVCLFADAGAYGTVTVFGPVDQGPISARTMREAVEHRA